MRHCRLVAIEFDASNSVRREPWFPAAAATWFWFYNLCHVILAVNPPVSISDSFANTEWDALAHTLRTAKSGVHGNDAASKRLRAEMGLIRMLMCDEIKGWNGNNTIELSFFMASFKTIQKLQKETDAHGIKSSEFLTFLKLLFYKFEKQKIRVKKPIATLAEFRKMKRVVENGHNPV